MLTYQERIELKDKIINGEIDIEGAITQYWNEFEDGKRSWQSKDWKERRSKIIKDKCQLCGSKETLTLQHLSHPKKYSEYLREITKAYASEQMITNSKIDKNKFTTYVIHKYDFTAVSFCPYCKFSKPIKRVRKLPKYRCATCRHEFDTPTYYTIEDLISIFYENEDAYEVRDKCFTSKDKWKNKHNLSNIRYWFLRDLVKNKNSESIKKEAFLLYLNDDIKYLSFEDTITACKRCASYYDLYNLELCPQCKQNYKGIQYPTCIQCLPDEKRKAALESIEFGKQWRQMHKDLGID